MGIDLGDSLAARPQPLLHHLDLVFLGELDALCQPVHLFALAPRGEELGHLERLGVVRDHPLHEPHVGVPELDAREIGGFFCRDLPTGLARSTRLDDRSLRTAL